MLASHNNNLTSFRESLSNPALCGLLRRSQSRWVLSIHGPESREVASRGRSCARLLTCRQARHTTESNRADLPSAMVGVLDRAVREACALMRMIYNGSLSGPKSLASDVRGDLRGNALIICRTRVFVCVRWMQSAVSCGAPQTVDLAEARCSEEFVAQRWQRL